MPRKNKTMKINLRAKILCQLLDVTGSSIDSWNPAIISDDMKIIPYIRNISDTWNPSQLNEALKLLGFRTVDTWNPAQIEETKNNLVQYFLPKIATGNPIELNLAGNFPYTVESAKVTMLPIQSGSGDPSPENVRPISGRDSVVLTRTGKNLFDKSHDQYNNQRINVTYGTTYGASGYKTSYYIEIFPDTQFKLLGSTENSYYAFYDENKTMISGSGGAWAIGTNKRSPISAKYVRFDFPDASLNNVQLQLTAIENTDYEPYSTETYTATFPSTVYGGEYEFVSGKLSDEWVEIEKYDGEALPGEWISDRDAYAEGTTPTIGAQVVYKTTPTTTTLTPQSISLNKGENVISSNADNIELNYKINFN